MTKNSSDDGMVVIKKYANRRLYNTASSSYITLDDLSQMTREGIDFKVLDAKSGEDITHSILTQIIMEEESNRNEQLLPVSFLRQLIAMYGNSMQTMMPSYLEAMMANFSENQAKLQEAFAQKTGENPLAKLAETNMAMMRAATEAFIPKPAPAKPSAEEGEAKTGDELSELRAQMAAMQKKLDQLGN
ncbi:polyhydroxyalkanoate synthesis repressor PhaR [Altererythrobacter sp. FM1]|uniref:polyhydroxyalkanoate synthesis repressor PhaR n=1 Tax=Tsuneonella flava TaxID=2055955 RepID=UPI000C7FFDFA|nr:polyhydroxyalkanoate synthesis repressor PhaR [Tsuneonella flava]ROT95451.1 polyhydroxyalkanoate synthesis repressor PhaR [Altererythrobacter sp. FM1]